MNRKEKFESLNISKKIEKILQKNSWKKIYCNTYYYQTEIMKNFNLHTISYCPMLEKQAWTGISVLFGSIRDNSKLGFLDDMS